MELKGEPVGTERREWKKRVAPVHTPEWKHW